MKLKFFMLAKKLSQHSDHHQHKLGAAIAYGNKIISTGFNKNKTSPKSNHKWNRLHAEVCAIINAQQDLTGCEIYIYRECKDGTLGLSRPCESCYSAIKEAGIRKIYYSSPEGYKEEYV